MGSKGMWYQWPGCRAGLRFMSTETERGGHWAKAGVVDDPGLGKQDSGESGYVAYVGVTAEEVVTMRPSGTGEM